MRGALPPNIDAIEGIPTQPAVPLEVPLNETAAAPVQQVAVATAAPQVQNVTVAGKTIAVTALLDRATEITVDGEPRKLVPLRSLRGTGRYVELVDGQGHTMSVTPDSGFALAPNQRGELKLVAPSAGFKKVFGPVTQIRWTN